MEEGVPSVGKRPHRVRTKKDPCGSATAGGRRTCLQLFVCPERGSDRPWVREARRLDEDVVKHGLLQHEALERVDKVVLHTAAEAAVRELDPLVDALLAPGFVLQQRLLDATLVPDLVQDDRDAEAVVLRKDIVDERGLACPCTGDQVLLGMRSLGRPHRLQVAPWPHRTVR